MRLLVALAALALCSCADVGFGAGGSGGSSTDSVGAGGDPGSLTSTATSTVMSSSTSLPGGCSGDQQCSDGNPCTVDTCDLGTCSYVQVAVGELGVGDGCPQGALCQADGDCGLSIWQHPLGDSAAPWTRTAVSAVWTGENAPPPRGITAADMTDDGRLLLVFAEDHLIYRRLDGTWLPPVTASEVAIRPQGQDPSTAPELDPARAGSMTTWRYTSNGIDRLWVRQAYGDGRQLLYVLDFDSSDPSAFVTVGPYYGVFFPADVRANAPPVDTSTNEWAFAQQSSFEGSPNWLYEHYFYDGLVYTVDSDAPSSDIFLPPTSLTNSPAWPSNATCPCPTNGIVAAYVKDRSILSFIAP